MINLQNKAVLVLGAVPTELTARPLLFIFFQNNDPFRFSASDGQCLGDVFLSEISRLEKSRGKKMSKPLLAIFFFFSKTLLVRESLS